MMIRDSFYSPTALKRLMLVGLVFISLSAVAQILTPTLQAAESEDEEMSEEVITETQETDSTDFADTAAERKKLELFKVPHRDYSRWLVPEDNPSFE